MLKDNAHLIYEFRNILGNFQYWAIDIGYLDSDVIKWLIKWLNIIERTYWVFILVNWPALEKYQQIA